MQHERGVQGRDSEAGPVHRQPQVLVRQRARLSFRHQEGGDQDPVRWFSCLVSTKALDVYQSDDGQAWCKHGAPADHLSGAVEGNRFKLSFPNSPKHDFFEVFHHGHYFFPINPTALLLLNLDDLSNLFTSHTRTERVAFLTTILLLSLTFGHLKRCSGKSVGHEWHHKMVIFLLYLLQRKKEPFERKKTLSDSAGRRLSDLYAPEHFAQIYRCLSFPRCSGFTFLSQICSLQLPRVKIIL